MAKLNDVSTHFIFGSYDVGNSSYSYLRQLNELTFFSTGQGYREILLRLTPQGQVSILAAYHHD